MALALFLIWCLAAVIYEPLALVMLGVYLLVVLIYWLASLRPTGLSGYERPPAGGAP